MAQTLGLLFFRALFLAACHRRYGELVRLQTLFGPGFVVVFDPKLVAELLRVPGDRACAGAANAASEPLHGGRSLLLLDGDEHLEQRRLLLPCFHGERMRSYESAILGATDAAIDSWPVGKPFALAPSIESLTLDVIIRAVLGIDDDRRRSQLNRSVHAMLRASRGRRFERHRRVVDALIHAEIADRRGSEGLARRPDALSTMLAASAGSDADAMTDTELRDELVMLLVAGHETTASGLAWAFDLLLRDPRVLERLHQALEDGEEDYLDAVIKETLRLRPVVTGIGRLVADRPLELGGYLIDSGIEVTPSIAAIHERPDRHPQPAAFRPERFLGENPPDAEAWLPFGGGTRRCLGASFAGFEMRTVIRRVLERTHLAPVGSRPERGVRRGVTPPTRQALARSLRRGRRQLPRRGVRVIQSVPPSPPS